MDLYGRSTARNGSQPDPPVGWAPAAAGGAALEESVRRMGLWGREFYPERPGVPDCAYYMRNGTCGYGGKCRYNHPRDRGPVGGALRIGGGEYPERVGEPPCQYFLRTGMCKFGASCKFHHPKNVVGSLNNVPLNIYGYPLRPDEKECSYYLKTGQCKFGVTCKFHHPQPAGVSLPASARPFYPTVQSPSAPSPEHYGGPSASYRVPRPPLLTGSYMPGAAYGPLLLPPGMVPIPNWSPYSGGGPVSPALSPGARPSVGAASLYGISQLSSSPPAFAGTYPPLTLSGGPSSSSSQKEKVFPERPGEQECQYYMKTGDCKFGSSCRFHHPLDRGASQTILSPLGLPLRQGVQPCSYYLQKGTCKFGRTCKFDHPMDPVRYSPPGSSLTNMPAAAPFATQTPASFTELRPEFISGSRVHSSGNGSSSSVGLIFSQSGPVSRSDVQLSSQSSSSLSISRNSRSMRQGGEV